MSTLASMIHEKENLKIETNYRICAEMLVRGAEGKSLHPLGMVRWIGSELDVRYPHWTTEEHATKFLPHESAATFYRNVNGHSYLNSLYQPKPGTTVIVETVTTTHVSTAAKAL